VIHSTLLVAVQLQVVCTANDPLAPPGVTIADGGLSVNAQFAPSWRTVTVWPAIVIVPDRMAASRLAAARNPTVPLPDLGLPGTPPKEMVSHGTFATAVHWQEAGLANTVTVPVPPSSAIGIMVGLTE